MQESLRVAHDTGALTKNDLGRVTVDTTAQHERSGTHGSRGAVGIVTKIACSCGTVAFEVHGRPIIAVECHCADFRNAGRRLEALLGARPILSANGGTPLVLVREDRIGWIRGVEKVAEHRLTSDSPTRRLVATCCNTAMMLDFTKGHWLTPCAAGFPVGTAPLTRMRVQTADAPRDAILNSDLLNAHRWPPNFFARAFWAGPLMRFHRPRHLETTDTIDG